MKVSKNKLRKVQSTSFPRSGHHLLVNCLLAYYGETPYVQKTSGEIIIPELIGSWNFVYCEYYNHCYQVPCAHPATCFQKNHDDDWHSLVPYWESKVSDKRLDTSVVPGSSLDPLRQKGGTLFLVQYRNLIDTLVSYFKIKTIQGYYEDWDFKSKTFVRREDTEESWRDFAINNKILWNEFMNRWVRSPIPDSLLLPYEDLISDPFGSMKKVLKYFDPPGEINEDYLREVVRIQDINPKNDIKKFKYYDEKFFRQLQL